MKTETDRTIQNRLFDVAWILFVFTQLLTLTGWYALDDSALKVLAYKGSTVITCGLCAAVIIINLIKRKYRLKTFICYALFGVISALSWYYNGNLLLLVMFLLFMAAYELSSRRVVFIAAFITAAVTFVTIALAELGIVENYMFSVASHRPRCGLGFSWATNAPTLLFFFVMMYIFLRKSSMRFWEYLILEAVNVYMYLRTDTNMPFYLVTAILACFFVQGLFKNHWRALRHLKWLYYLSPLIICGATLFLYMVIDYNSQTWVNIWFKINDILNNRLLYGKQGIYDHFITLFGQHIDWNGSTITADVPYTSYNYVDCSYIRVMLDYGLVYLAAAVGVYTRLMVRAVKKADFWLVFITIAVLLHSFTEPRLMDMSFNLIPMLAFLKLGEEPVMYKKGSLKEIFAGES